MYTYRLSPEHDQELTRRNSLILLCARRRGYSREGADTCGKVGHAGVGQAGVQDGGGGGV
jgi:hypothetical protein